MLLLFATLLLTIHSYASYTEDHLSRYYRDWFRFQLILGSADAALQGYMSLDARIKTPRADRVGTRRQRHKRNVVERIWAYETMRELTNKAIESTDDTTRAIVLATVQQIGSQVLSTSSFLTTVGPIVLMEDWVGVAAVLIQTQPF